MLVGLRRATVRCAQAAVLRDQAALAAWADGSVLGAVPMMAAAAQLRLAAARHDVRLDLPALAAAFYLNAARVKAQEHAHRCALVAAAAQARGHPPFQLAAVQEGLQSKRCLLCIAWACGLDGASGGSSVPRDSSAAHAKCSVRQSRLLWGAASQNAQPGAARSW